MHLLASNFFSGAENVVCQIIEMFHGYNGFEMAYASEDGKIHETLAARNITFIPMQRLSLSEVSRVIRLYKPDIVHAHDVRASVVAAGAGGRVRLLSHIHGNNVDMHRVNPKTLLYLLASARFSHIFWVSNSSFNQYCFRKLLDGKSTVLYNVINRDSLLSRMAQDTNEYSYDAVYIGRLTAPKNPQRLMRVISKLVKKTPEVRIAVAGSGDLEEETKNLASELNISGNITFLGYVTNPIKLLHDAKAMLLTSDWEGTPMVALEAMALGVPIVSTPADGMIELIQNGENGFLTADEEIFSEKLYAIISDPGLRSDLSRNALRTFDSLVNPHYYKNTLYAAYIN